MIDATKYIQVQNQNDKPVASQIRLDGKKIIYVNEEYFTKFH